MKTAYTFIFQELFFEDVEEAIFYYEQIKVGLGQRFSTDLEKTLITIYRNPLFASQRYKDRNQNPIRCAQLPIFPYLIHYYVNNNTGLVTILAVYSTHQKRRT